MIRRVLRSLGWGPKPGVKPKGVEQKPRPVTDQAYLGSGSPEPALIKPEPRAKAASEPLEERTTVEASPPSSPSPRDPIAYRQDLVKQMGRELAEYAFEGDLLKVAVEQPLEPGERLSIRGTDPVTVVFSAEASQATVRSEFEARGQDLGEAVAALQESTAKPATLNGAEVSVGSLQGESVSGIDELPEWARDCLKSISFLGGSVTACSTESISINGQTVTIRKGTDELKVVGPDRTISFNGEPVADKQSGARQRTIITLPIGSREELEFDKESGSIELKGDGQVKVKAATGDGAVTLSEVDQAEVAAPRSSVKVRHANEAEVKARSATFFAIKGQARATGCGDVTGLRTGSLTADRVDGDLMLLEVGSVTIGEGVAGSIEAEEVQTLVNPGGAKGRVTLTNGGSAQLGSVGSLKAEGPYQDLQADTVGGELNLKRVSRATVAQVDGGLEADMVESLTVKGAVNLSATLKDGTTASLGSVNGSLNIDGQAAQVGRVDGYAELKSSPSVSLGEVTRSLTAHGVDDLVVEKVGEYCDVNGTTARLGSVGESLKANLSQKLEVGDVGDYAQVEGGEVELGDVGGFLCAKVASLVAQKVDGYAELKVTDARLGDVRDWLEAEVGGRLKAGKIGRYVDVRGGELDLGTIDGWANLRGCSGRIGDVESYLETKYCPNLTHGEVDGSVTHR